MDHANNNEPPRYPQNRQSSHMNIPPNNSFGSVRSSQGRTGPSTTSNRQPPQQDQNSSSRNSSEVGSSSQNQQHHRSPAASIIRSILDDATPSTAAVSEDYDELARDDDSESGFAFSVPRHDASSSFSTPTIPPSLQSLQVETLPALPDEQDRKRFLGCLAAVLASSYDYDEPDETIPGSSSSSRNNGDDPYFRYLEQAELSHEEGGEEELIQQSQSQSSSPNRSNRFQSQNSFEYSHVDEMKENPLLGSSSEHGTQQPYNGHKNNSATSRAQQQQQKQQPALPRQSSNSSTFWGTSAKEKARIARDRHRRRRYSVMSRLLMNASELLLLEKGTARGFLPMLARVLVPESNKLSTKSAARTSSSERRPPLPTKNHHRHSNNMQSRSVPSSPATKMSSPDRKTSASFTADPATSFEAELLQVPMIDTPMPQNNKTKNLEEEEEEQHDKQMLANDFDHDDVLRPFLESLTPGAGFRCIALFLLQYLLTSEVGYDARIRHVIKKLGVIVLVHDMEQDPVDYAYEHIISGPKSSRDPEVYKLLVGRATRKFEALEHSIAKRLIRLSESNAGQKPRKQSDPMADANDSRSGLTREQIVRAAKIGSAGLVAGTLFAFTGGLAAPGLAAGLGAFAGSAAATAAVVTLTSAHVVTTIFGVGGGTLAAYKMQRRTEGLTEFEFRKETNSRSGERKESRKPKSGIEAELFSTICFSGWLRDEMDFQRPWGLHPTSPRLRDRLELLERFYSIHSPEHVPKCERILESWKGEEKKLWSILREKYGCDPDHLFPLKDGPRFQGGLTLEQEEVLGQLFVELGYNSRAEGPQKPQEEIQSSPLERMKAGWNGRASYSEAHSRSNGHLVQYPSVEPCSNPSAALVRSLAVGNNNNNSSRALTRHQDSKAPDDEEDDYEFPDHLETVWDYKTTYGGEMYTVKWESELLKTICDCVMDLAMDVVTGATRQILKQTVLSTLLAAIVWPTYLINVANMIDGDWTLAVERADEAGKELARILLFSRAGHRPVTLVGFSFGGRIVYSCLKELAKFQEEWEEYEELKQEHAKTGGPTKNRRMTKFEEKFKGMREPASIVEDAIIMGVPNHLNLNSWRACRHVVAGRLVNCYSRNDLILSLMFQAKRLSGNFSNSAGSSLLKPVCGTCPVLVPGVENFDVSDMVSGHQDYCLVTGKILERVRHGQPLRSALAGAEDFEGFPTDSAAKKLEY